MLWRVPDPNDGLELRFWGVRGSVCVSGQQHATFGGHTPCLEVRCGRRLFVVDAGTGITRLGAAHGADLPEEIDLLFSHLHLDHTTGLAFFKPAVLDPKRVIHTYCGNLDGASAAEALDRLYSPPLFPIRLEQLPAKFVHHGFRAGESLTFGDGAVVETVPLNHPGGATGYRFQHAGRSACYISDVEHGPDWPPPELVRFCAGADLVVFDGMFTEAEYPRCKGWGHSTWQKGVALCEAAGAGSLAVVHLYPGHDDAALAAMEAELQAVMPSAFVAREGQALTLAPRAAAPITAARRR